jgi:tetratricopeptide (TPR) repeat protein
MLQECIEAFPADARPHLLYAELLTCLGRKSEAEPQLGRALQLAGEPCDRNLLEDAGFVFYMLEDYGRALGLLRRAAAISPRIMTAHWRMGLCHWQLGALDKAQASLDRSRALAEGLYRVSRAYRLLNIDLLQGLIHEGSGDRAAAQAAARRLQELPEVVPDRAFAIAIILLHTHDTAEGLRWIRESIAARDPSLRRLGCFSLPDEVISDHRFVAAIEPLGVAIS